MKVIQTALDGVYRIEPKVFGDARGFFMESWSERAFEAQGLRYHFVQDNHSLSEKRGTLRGIHFQRGAASQAKLVRCVRGKILDVAVDLRPGSPTYGQWIAEELTAENFCQLLIPRGFGHGFVTLTDGVEVLYKADNPYVPQSEGGIIWNDPTLQINWGIQSPILSEKDQTHPSLQNAVTDF